MKFLIPLFCVLVAIAAASHDDKTMQCSFCKEFEALLNERGEFEQDASNSVEVTDQFELYQQLCTGCKTESESIAVMQQESDEKENDDMQLETTNLLSITNCKTCRSLIDEVAKHCGDFSYPQIKYAVSKACSAYHIKLWDTARCKVFVNLRKDKIIRAIYKYHLESTSICLDLGQC